MEIYNRVVHEKKAEKPIASKMSNLRLWKKTRHHCIVHRPTQ